MIILDEQLLYSKIIDAIERWYKGRVSTILDLRPDSLIKDDGIPTLLHKANQPTFVTINVKHFWRKANAHAGYCIIAIDVAQDESAKAPTILRSILNLDEFRTKAKRMGKVIRWRDGQIRYYGLDNRVITL